MPAAERPHNKPETEAPAEEHPAAPAAGAHDKRKTLARNQRWQEAIDDLAAKHPEKNHFALCRMLKKQADITWEVQTIRRHTKLRRVD